MLVLVSQGEGPRAGAVPIGGDGGPPRPGTCRSIKEAPSGSGSTRRIAEECEQILHKMEPDQRPLAESSVVRHSDAQRGHVELIFGQHL